MLGLRWHGPVDRPSQLGPPGADKSREPDDLARPDLQGHVSHAGCGEAPHGEGNGGVRGGGRFGG